MWFFGDLQNNNKTNKQTNMYVCIVYVWDSVEADLLSHSSPLPHDSETSSVKTLPSGPMSSTEPEEWKWHASIIHLPLIMLQCYLILVPLRIMTMLLSGPRMYAVCTRIRAHTHRKNEQRQKKGLKMCENTSKTASKGK